MNKVIYLLILSIVISSCSSMSDYAKNILSDPRNEKLVYKTNEDYSSSQIELLIPPNLSQPANRESLALPEIVKNNSDNLFTVDTKLENIKIFRQGKNMFLSVSSSDKLALWEKNKIFLAYGRLPDYK